MANTSKTYWHGIVAGLAGGVAWLLSHTFIFGPIAQFVLFDADFQSEKFLSVWVSDPLPRQSQTPLQYILGLLLVSLLWGVAYIFLADIWTQAWWKNGLRFGVLLWALIVPWFEFFVPWNVLLEPLTLVVLEVICWLIVWLCVGLAVARTASALRGGGNPDPA